MPLGNVPGLSEDELEAVRRWVFAAAALTIYVITTMVNSTYGRGFLATHDDEVAAEEADAEPSDVNRALPLLRAGLLSGAAGGRRAVA